MYIGYQEVVVVVLTVDNKLMEQTVQRLRCPLIIWAFALDDNLVKSCFILFNCIMYWTSVYFIVSVLDED